MVERYSELQAKKLCWDSEFFGFPVGSLELYNSELAVTDLSKYLKSIKGDYKLIYVFTDESFIIDNNILRSFNGELVDIRVYFYKELKAKYDSVPYQKLITKDIDISKSIFDLVISSGKFSRFNIDKKFPEDSFERLYKTWLINIITRKIADGFYFYRENQDINGFISYSFYPEHARIELIAVDLLQQRKGIATTLLNAVENICIDKKLLTLEVCTQKINYNACKFYEKNEFVKHKETNIYHFWI